MSIPSPWKAWRSNRRRALVADGMPAHIAARLAAQETFQRMRIAQTTGDVAAMRGELVPSKSGGLALMGDWNLVPESQRPTVASMMAVQATTKH